MTLERPGARGRSSPASPARPRFSAPVPPLGDRAERDFFLDRRQPGRGWFSLAGDYCRRTVEPGRGRDPGAASALARPAAERLRFGTTEAVSRRFASNVLPRQAHRWVSPKHRAAAGVGRTRSDPHGPAGAGSGCRPEVRVGMGRIRPRRTGPPRGTVAWRAQRDGFGRTRRAQLRIFDRASVRPP